VELTPHARRSLERANDPCGLLWFLVAGQQATLA